MSTSPIDPTDIQHHLPLSEPVFHILLALADQPRHGYGIILEVEERTGGSIRLGAGTLYSAIKRLRDSNLLEEAGAGEDSGEDPRRKYYRLTALGRELVRAETRRLEGLVSQAHDKILRSSLEPGTEKAG